MTDWKFGLSDSDIYIFLQIAKHWNLTPENLYDLIQNNFPRIKRKDSDHQEHVMYLIKGLYFSCKYVAKRTACETCGKLNLFYDYHGYHKKYTKNYIHNHNEAMVNDTGDIYVTHCKGCYLQAKEKK